MILTCCAHSRLERVAFGIAVLRTVRCRSAPAPASEHKRLSRISSDRRDPDASARARAFAFNIWACVCGAVVVVVAVVGVSLFPSINRSTTGAHTCMNVCVCARAICENYASQKLITQFNAVKPKTHTHSLTLMG